MAVHLSQEYLGLVSIDVPHELSSLIAAREVLVGPCLLNMRC